MSAKLLPWSCFLLVPVVCVAMLLPQDDGTKNSFVCTVAVMFHAAILFFPIIAGVSAMDAVFFVKSRSRFIVEAQPPSVRLRLAIDRSLTIAAAGGMGILVSVGLAAIMTSMNGSHLRWDVWPYCAIVLMGILAVSFLGSALGLVIKSWFFPIVLVAGLYVASAFEIPYIYLQTEALSSIWTPHPSLVEFSPWYLYSCLGLHGCMAVLGLCIQAL